MEDHHGRYEVDISVMECSCHLWQTSSLPCIHAVAFKRIRKHQL